MRLRVILLATSASFACCSGFAQPAPTNLPPAAAPAVAAKPAPIGLEEVVVTARKRQEKLLQVPISITALSSKDLQKRGVYSISDLADQTPGLTVDGTQPQSGRNDRSFPAYVIRGIAPSLPTNPTTTVFLDGAPLISGQIDNLEDLDRVEVLKGPQSAYFGRQTFAGAISLVTKDPTNTPSIVLDLLAASPNYYDERVKFEGPIVPDKLWVSGSYRYYSRQGSWDNEAVADKTSQHLGDQSTQSGTAEIVARPVDDLKIKALGLYWRDNDGPSAQYLVEPSQSNCLGFWFCGTVPDRLANQPATNNLVTPAIQALLKELGSPAGNQGFKPLNKGYGLVRDAYHGSLAVDYNVEPYGFTVSSLSAIDNQKYSELQDLANDDGSAIPNAAYALGLPLANRYDDYPFFVEQAYRSLSQELRVTSDSDQRFRYVFGVNYEWNRVDRSLGGGNGFDFFQGDSPETSSTYSAFYGLNYDILSNLTLSFEGRYQSDKIATAAWPNAGKFANTYTDFLPRISLEYKFSPDLMAYVTYSDGVNPGQFNGFIKGLPASIQQELATDYGARVQVQPEKLTNYEIGTKGSFLGNTLHASVDLYYDIWYHQIGIAYVNYFIGQSLQNTTADVNNGKVDLAGVEGEFDWEPIHGLTFNLGGAINESAITHGRCFTCIEETGSGDVDGKQLANTSKYQATFGAEYTSKFSFLEGTALQTIADWSYFGRLDYVFKSGSYIEPDDLVQTPDENLLNLRVGVTHGDLTLEGFVDNVTNWSGPTALAGIVNLGNPAETYVHTYDAIVAGLPDLRTYGVRLHYKFGLPPAPTPTAEPTAPEPVAPPVAPVRTYLVFFDWDRADLTDRARQIVQTAAQASTHVQTTQIEVNGYTDLSGTPAYNQKLSVRRADAVQTELVHDGVPKSEISIHGFGESHPLVPTANGVREPQNRRVEIILK